MVTKLNPDNLFEDAKGLYATAVKELETGNIRSAAEKSWEATVRAAICLIVARTGEEPSTILHTRIAIEREAERFPVIDSLRLEYLSREASLHRACFYDGICEPSNAIERRIRETCEFIDEAMKLARF